MRIATPAHNFIHTFAAKKFLPFHICQNCSLPKFPFLRAKPNFSEKKRRRGIILGKATPLALYFHIPFCKQACHYCDFHFSTQLRGKASLVAALAREVELRRDFFPDPAPLASVYFGGGTPSLLDQAELDRLLDQVAKHFALAPGAEVTLEANPDDLTAAKLAQLRASGINRLSIGIQSFHGPHLAWANRAHTAAQATACVPLAQAAGFANLSVDLIFGLPAPDHGVLEADLAQLLALRVPHVSAYCLTIEPKTAFGNWLRRGQLQPVPEDYAAQQFELVAGALAGAGYEHYEISNYAQPGHYSRHNTNYWKKGPYLGLGPSAHSYDGQHRYANVANNAQYVRAIGQGQVPAERETLTPTDHLNEYLMTSLRTQWGCDLAHVRARYGHDLARTEAARLASWQAQGLLTVEAGVVRLTLRGQLVADQLAAELFVGAP
jgi:oxygen-independent coproporphyrinogen III oxidase